MDGTNVNQDFHKNWELIDVLEHGILEKIEIY